MKIFRYWKMEIIQEFNFTNLAEINWTHPPIKKSLELTGMHLRKSECI